MSLLTSSTFGRLSLRPEFPLMSSAKDVIAGPASVNYL